MRGGRKDRLAQGASPDEPKTCQRQRIEDGNEHDEAGEHGIRPPKGRMWRNPFNRRNNRPTSLRRPHVSRSHTQGLSRIPGWGATGPNPDSGAGWRVPSPYVCPIRQQGRFPLPAPGRRDGLRPPDRIMDLPRGWRECRYPSGIPRQTHEVCRSAPTGSAVDLGTVFSCTGSVRRSHLRGHANAP